MLTGQPGTGTGASFDVLALRDNSRGIRSSGKTTFLKWMTARLIAAHQVVVLCDYEDVRLFYHGKVYIRSAAAGYKHPPEHLTKPYFPMRGLIDVDFQETPPRISGGSSIWPI